MKGDAQIIFFFQVQLKNELSAINQYFCTTACTKTGGWTS